MGNVLNSKNKRSSFTRIGTSVKRFINQYGILIILLLVVSLIYRFDKILLLEPQSIHQWRQADCLSIAHNYTDNLNFFEPSIHYHFSDESTSGKSAGEFPILYYLVALFWKLFGEHIFIYRLINVLIFFTGLVYLFDSCSRIFKHKFWAYFVVVFAFSSPVLVYYSVNFLTNVTALSMVFIGWNMFIRYCQNKKDRFLFYMALFFSLSALLKMTAAISLLALFGILILEILGRRFISKEPLFLNKSKSFLIFLSSFVIISSWYLWAEYYNGVHGGKYTLNWFWPIWEMNKAQIDAAFHSARNIIYYQAFSRFSMYFLWAILLYLIVDFRNNSKFINALVPIVTIGTISYLVLWFNALDGHDYYIINLLILPIILLVGFVLNLEKKMNNILLSKKIQLLALIFLIANITNAAVNLRLRYNKHFDTSYTLSRLLLSDFEADYWIYFGNNNSFEGLSEMQAYNRSLGIKADDLIIYLPDKSYNVSLYLLNQKGWTGYSGLTYSGTNTYNEILEKVELKGAKYLIIGDKKLLKEKRIKPFVKNKIGRFGKNLVFDLQNLDLNKSLN